jgi:hypothetical protein
MLGQFGNAAISHKLPEKFPRTGWIVHHHVHTLVVIPIIDKNGVLPANAVSAGPAQSISELPDGS